MFALGHSLIIACQGKPVDGLSNLAANPVYPLRLSDKNVAQSDNGGRFASIQSGKLNHMNCNGHTTWGFRT